MAKKKGNFAANVIADATAELLPGQTEMNLPGIATPEEATPAPKGRRGRKPTISNKDEAQRINMEFPPEVRDYIATMSQVTGQSMTQFVNKIVKDHMNKHMDDFVKTKAFIESLKAD